jgi:GDP-mannose transporter
MHQNPNSGVQFGSPTLSTLNITTPLSAAVDPLQFKSRNDFNENNSNTLPQTPTQQQQSSSFLNTNGNNNNNNASATLITKHGFDPEAAVALCIYSVCSISMILLNKRVMDTYKLDFPLGLLFLQNFAALLLVVGAKQLKWIHYPNFDMNVVKKWLPLTFFFVLMLWTSMKSLRTMSVAAQTILKNLAIIFTALGDWFFFKKQLTMPMFAAFGLMIFGSWLGSASDPWVTPEGVFWTFANIFCTVSYVLYMKNLLSAVTNEIGKYGPVFYNNLLSLPFLFLPAVPTLPDLFDAIGEAPGTAKLCLVLMVFIGAVMTFGTFWAMRATSPTTYAITGALNKVPLAFLGIIIFGHYPDGAGYVGICFALGAGVLYAWVTRPVPKSAASSAPPLRDTGHRNV